MIFVVVLRWFCEVEVMNVVVNGGLRWWKKLVRGGGN